MSVLKAGEKLIAKEIAFKSGTIGRGGGGIKDAYDLYLVEDASKNLTLIIYMELQFIFKGSGTLTWAKADKKAFVTQFETDISRVWGNKRTIKNLTKGKKIFLDFRFRSLIGGVSIFENWEVHVKKIKAGTFSRSSVNPIKRTVNLDSEDVSFVTKSGGGRQRGVVHEFGHMLGLPDEYHAGHAFAADSLSVMNGGENLRGRHDAVYINWLNTTLTKKGIK